LRARPDNDAFDPQTDEGQELAEGDHDVGIVGARLLDHAAKLGIAVSADHGEHAADDPDHECHVDRSGASGSKLFSSSLMLRQNKLEHLPFSNLFGLV